MGLYSDSWDIQLDGHQFLSNLAFYSGKFAFMMAMNPSDTVIGEITFGTIAGVAYTLDTCLYSSRKNGDLAMKVLEVGTDVSPIGSTGVKVGTAVFNEVKNQTLSERDKLMRK